MIKYAAGLSMTDQLNHAEVRFNLKIQGRCHQLEEEGIPERPA